MSSSYASAAVRGDSHPPEGDQTSIEPVDAHARRPATGAKPATPYHCPFCGEEDLRPVEDDATAWSCRSCARVFTVGLVRIDHSLIPALRPDQAEVHTHDGPSGPLEPAGQE